MKKHSEQVGEEEDEDAPDAVAEAAELGLEVVVVFLEGFGAFLDAQ